MYNNNIYSLELLHKLLRKIGWSRVTPAKWRNAVTALNWRGSQRKNNFKNEITLDILGRFTSCKDPYVSPIYLFICQCSFLEHLILLPPENYQIFHGLIKMGLSSKQLVTTICIILPIHTRDPLTGIISINELISLDNN